MSPGGRFAQLGVLLAGSLVVMSFAVSSEVARSVPEDWKKIDAEGHFTFFLPPGMEKGADRGRDSYVEVYRSADMRVSFDYGQWSNTLKDFAEKPEYQEVRTKIAGKRAKVVTFYDPESSYEYKYVAAAHFPDVRKIPFPIGWGKLTFWANGKGIAEQEIAKQIFHSISFP